jgi:hypothetical protein
MFLPEDIRLILTEGSPFLKTFERQREGFDVGEVAGPGRTLGPLQCCFEVGFANAG